MLLQVRDVAMDTDCCMKTAPTRTRVCKLDRQSQTHPSIIFFYVKNVNHHHVNVCHRFETRR